ncbi:hypothetical protein caldi_32450 [Caldinitratiruptor microaerophilus]|uniref:Uncharacterized protein n=1 Tax=Caldinitratiruptor microaerophilus TaxID=671077 RepID=A0AA35CQW5_9FIRM|nr:hypothetical protein caldi_32450 [Caldinitratiruptor microaerophilus]
MSLGASLTGNRWRVKQVFYKDGTVLALDLPPARTRPPGRSQSAPGALVGTFGTASQTLAVPDLHNNLPQGGG